jgi:Zn-dependent peptidase ImmA (M78 family)
MSSVTWRYLAGDTASFAIELSLISDELDDWMVDADERASWGAVALWVRGINVCEHAVQGETLRAAHWYLLPIVEWLVEHWEPLLHEERQPIPSAGMNAAQGFSRAATLGELHAASGHGFGLAEATQAWYRRHGLRSAAQGGIVPDVYIRRYGDYIEFSTGSEHIAGEDWGAIFTQPLQAARVPVSDVPVALGDAVESLTSVLLKRTPDSIRYQELSKNIAALTNPAREPIRFAWLSGAGERVDAFLQLWNDVRSAIPTDLQQDLQRLDDATNERRLAAFAPPAALLFGSLAPDISVDDMVTLYTALMSGTQDPQVADELRSLGGELLSTWPIAGLSPGEQGSVYGEEAWRRLDNSEARQVQIEKILTEMGVGIDNVALQDSSIRAVSMTGVDGAARIVVNRNFRMGTSQPVRRFTLAHELGHLLLDQDRASRMIVASGPWAPLEVEQRANAFAAAFLIPLPLLDKFWTPDPTSDVIRAMAHSLAVSFSALVSRLQNIGRISPEDAESLRSEVLDQ